MNEEQNNMMTCPKCGEAMRVDARYCMKCGYLNSNNEANKNIQKYINKGNSSNVTTYHVSNGEMKVANMSVSTNVGNTLICFLVNYLVYLLLIGISFYTILGKNVTDWMMVINSPFPLVMVILSVIFLSTYAMESIYIKANKRWWMALIPIYNLFILADITFHKKIYGVITLIPIVGQIFMLVMLYQLGKKFEYNGFLVAILPIIMIPVIGFGYKKYENCDYIREEKEIQRDYKTKKIFLVTMILMIIIGLGLTFYTRIKASAENSKSLRNYYIVYAADKIVATTRDKVNKNLINCNEYVLRDYKGISYVYYPDVGKKTFLLFYHMRDPIEGYVKVDTRGDETKYYVSLTDGTYGFSETLYEDVKFDTVVEYKEVSRTYDPKNECKAF